MKESMGFRIIFFPEMNNPPTFLKCIFCYSFGQPGIADKVLRKQFVLDLTTTGIADNIRADTMRFRIRHYGIVDKLLTSGIPGLPSIPPFVGFSSQGMAIGWLPLPIPSILTLPASFPPSRRSLPRDILLRSPNSTRQQIV